MTIDEMVELVHAVTRSDNKLYEVEAALRRIPELERQVLQLQQELVYLFGQRDAAKKEKRFG